MYIEVTLGIAYLGKDSSVMEGFSAKLPPVAYWASHGGWYWVVYAFFWGCALCGPPCIADHHT